MSVAVAKQYAQALYEALSPMDAARAAAVVRELEAVEALLEESAELRSVLLNPSVPANQKKNVVTTLAERGGLFLTPNFLRVVIDRRRLPIFRTIREAFEELVATREGVTRAQVTSAGALTAEQQEKIEKKLSSLTGGSVLCKYSSEEALLGGTVVQIGSTVYDGSVSGQIEVLRRRLIG